MLLGTLGASLFGNILAAKGINRAGEGILRAGCGNKKVEILKNKSIIRVNLDLMVFILEIIYPKLRIGRM